MEDKVNVYWASLQDLIVNYAGKLIFAIVVLIFGWWLINRIVKSVTKVMTKRDVDLSLRPFLTSIIKYTLRTVLILVVAGMIGIQMTSFIALLGAAGLAIGMALQGSLSNFAGGIIILILKPFKVGDFIESNGVSGTVKEIKVFHTFLTTLNRQEIIIPNGPLANATIINYSMHETRGLTMEFNVSYEYDIDKVKAVLDKVLLSHGDDLIKETPHLVRVSKLDEQFIEYKVQAWFKTSNFWPIHHQLIEKVMKELAKEDIVIPHSKTFSIQTIS